jgi:catechol-2,3-dioxygenase
MKLSNSRAPAKTDMSTTNPLNRSGALSLSHLGIYVRDLDRMGRFYMQALGFTETDRGLLGSVQLLFLSRDPSEHHQLVLASGRPEGPGFNLINQISLRVPDLSTLRAVHARMQAEPDVSDLVSVTHGNAISLYLRDPEGNRLEIFMDTAWYCEQPLREAISLDQPDEAILAQSEAMARSRPGFCSREVWQARMRTRMGLPPQTSGSDPH